MQFECDSGHIIDQQYRCNGRVECPLDQSDELGCCESLNLTVTLKMIIDVASAVGYSDWT